MEAREFEKRLSDGRPWGSSGPVQGLERRVGRTLAAMSLIRAVIAQRMEVTAKDLHSVSSIELATSGNKRK